MTHYQRLIDLREDHDLNQTQVAAILGMKQQQYSRYETGAQRMSIENYMKLAEFYNVSIDYLCGLIDRPRPLITGVTKRGAYRS